MQYTSAESYYDLPSCDDFEVDIIGVHRIKGHGVGGVVKKAIRRAVKSGDIFTTASEICS